MCGIAGFIKSKKENGLNQKTLMMMLKKLDHRGPDFKDYWIERNVFLGHTRLSIIDVSEKGNQPMVSHSGRFVIIFNGEIYNFKDLKLKLEKQKKIINWNGNSDTEVFLECIDFWGLTNALKLARGMFAFSIWDKKTKLLTLARDSIGEKPIYYGSFTNIFVFSSELKAIKSGFKKYLTHSKNEMNMMLRFGYVPSPKTIYKNVFKLLPGHAISINEETKIVKQIKWFDLQEEINKSRQKTINYNENKLHNVLRSAVKEQMNSDVPLGCLLSGGVDSSLITALMQEQSINKINTFTIGFTEDLYDEAKYAKEISRKLNTNHHELYVDSKTALDIIPKLPIIYDEPFGDSSQIPTILVSQLAGSYVKVCLSGDGGDELFGGYNRHIWSETIFNLLNDSIILQKLIKNIFLRLSPNNWNKFYKALSFLLPNALKVNNFGEKLYKILEVANFNSKEDLYIKLISQIRSDLPINHQYDEVEFFKNKINWSNEFSYLENLMLSDTLNYLPDDILVKVDRASMSCSLETRAPFLDLRVVKEAWQIPIEKKINKKSGKLPLKNILNKYLPQELIKRPKQGFALPIDTWLRTSLREWAENLLDDKTLEENLYFDPKAVKEIWKDHLIERRNWQYPIWNILMLQSWIENQN